MVVFVHGFEVGESLQDTVGEVLAGAALGVGRNDDGTLVVLTAVVVVAAALDAESNIKLDGRRSSRSIGFV